MNIPRGKIIDGEVVVPETTALLTSLRRITLFSKLERRSPVAGAETPMAGTTLAIVG